MYMIIPLTQNIYICMLIPLTQKIYILGMKKHNNAGSNKKIGWVFLKLYLPFVSVPVSDGCAISRRRVNVVGAPLRNDIGVRIA